jgi:hypothetical protein
VKSYPAKELRIPTIATTHSDESRPAVPIDRDPCGAMTGIDCCACAASGQAAAAPPSSVMNSRRLMLTMGLLPRFVPISPFTARSVPHAERTTEEDGRSLGNT